MIIAILIGRRGSRGFPGKNIHKVLGRRLCEYRLLAAKKSIYIDKPDELRVYRHYRRIRHEKLTHIDLLSNLYDRKWSCTCTCICVPTGSTTR